MVEREVSAWGRLGRTRHEWAPIADAGSIAPTLRRGQRPGLPFGNGRSYGDVCLNEGGTLWSTRGLDRFVSFDADTGVLACEAGVLLKDIIDLVLPRGWFLPVTPGTQYATVGGCVANDVHGKNHHRRGTFADHVLSLTLHRTDGSRIVCNANEEADWFRATVGGMGLTGLISRVTLQLLRVAGPMIEAEELSFDSLDGFFEISARSAADWEYSVSWIDCASGSALRGIFFRGNHSADAGPEASSKSVRFPFTPPVSLVNSLTLRPFNAWYYHSHRRNAGVQLRPLRPFFYPLDNILEWNRLYGPRGFYQYQCVVPRAVERDATSELLGVIAASGAGSFLGVLKTFGDRVAPGLMSFPMPGTTLALDFPNLGRQTTDLFERLNAVVAAAGGRIYPAKDAAMPRDLFESGYPAYREFAAFRDPGVSSSMSRRLFGS